VLMSVRFDWSGEQRRYRVGDRLTGVDDSHSALSLLGETSRNKKHAVARRSGRAGVDHRSRRAGSGVNQDEERADGGSFAAGLRQQTWLARARLRGLPADASGRALSLLAASSAGEQTAPRLSPDGEGARKSRREGKYRTGRCVLRPVQRDPETERRTKARHTGRSVLLV
jgi:hypothetical protein